MNVLVTGGSGRIDRTIVQERIQRYLWSIDQHYPEESNEPHTAS